MEDYNLGLPHPSALIGVKYYLINANDAVNDSMHSRLRYNHGSSFSSWIKGDPTDQEDVIRL